MGILEEFTHLLIIVFIILPVLYCIVLYCTPVLYWLPSSVFFLFVAKLAIVPWKL